MMKRKSLRRGSPLELLIDFTFEFPLVNALIKCFALLIAHLGSCKILHSYVVQTYIMCMCYMRKYRNEEAGTLVVLCLQKGDPNKYKETKGVQKRVNMVKGKCHSW